MGIVQSLVNNHFRYFAENGKAVGRGGLGDQGLLFLKAGIGGIG